MSEKRIYWATLPADEIAAEMKVRIGSFYEYLERSGRLRLWKNAYCLMYGLDADGGYKKSSAITFGGEEGETTELRVNHYRSLVQHVFTLITGTRPAVTASAINNDYESMIAAELAEGIIEYYASEMGMEEVALETMKRTITYSEGHALMEWDAELGDDYQVVIDEFSDESGEKVRRERVAKTGDVKMTSYLPWDVVRDPNLTDSEYPWVILHDRVSRFDLAARFPEREESILAAGSYAEQYPQYMRTDSQMGDADDDNVSTWKLIVRPSVAFPEGRIVTMVGDIVLEDTPCAYKSFPLITIMPESQDGTPFGYTTSHDLMAPQAALDSVVSTQITNHEAFGVQNIFVPTGARLEVEDLGGGLKMMQASDKPEPIQLTSISEHSYRISDMLLDTMQQLRGINDVARGNPAANVKSGNFGALLHAMALQYNSGEQAGYARLWARMANALIETLQSYAEAPRIAQVVGKDKLDKAQTFSSEKLSSVRRIRVELGSAIMQTTAGRQDVADKLLERGIIKDAEQYVAVFTSGKLSAIYDGVRSQRQLIRMEGEQLLGGKPQPVLATDHHKLHIQEHTALLAAPHVRSNEQLTALVLEHITMHASEWVNIDPVIAEASGQLPPQAAMAAMMGQEQMPPTSGAASPDGQPDAQMGGPAGEAIPNGPNMPALPENPLTGEAVNIEGGIA